MNKRLMDFRDEHGQLPNDRRDMPPPVILRGLTPRELVEDWTRQGTGRTAADFVNELRKTLPTAFNT